MQDVIATYMDKMIIDTTTNLTHSGMEKLKKAMGNHISARVSDYSLEWGFISYKAQPEKVTPAKEARTIRKSSIRIKKI